MRKEGLYQVIISSEKGGVGKSAHAAALAWAGVQHFNTNTYLLHTDNTEPTIIDTARGYRQYDCSYAGDPNFDKNGEQYDKLKKRWNKLSSIAEEGERTLLVIDNGGNKERLSLFLSKYGSLTVIPFTIDHGAIKRGLNHYNSILKANPDANVMFIVINHSGEKFSKRDQPIWDSVPDELKSKFHFLGKCADMNVFNTDDSIKPDGKWSSPSSKAAAYSRHFFKLVLDYLPDYDEEESED